MPLYAYVFFRRPAGDHANMADMPPCSSSPSSGEGKQPMKKQKMNFKQSPAKPVDDKSKIDNYWQELCYNWEARKNDKSIPKDVTGGLQLVLVEPHSGV